MKKFSFLFGLLFFNAVYGQMHDFLQEWNEDNRKCRIENRRVAEPIYESGDTLYLFYNPLDSLQSFNAGSKVLKWKLYDVSEKNWDKYEQAVRGFKLIEVRDSLNLNDLDGKVLTSRQEFCDFYQRVYKRSNGRENTHGGDRKMSFYFWDIGNHFTYVFVYVVQKDGMIIQYKTSLWGLTDIVM